MNDEPEFNVAAITPFLNGAVYLWALMYCGASFWRAGLVAVLVVIATLINCGRTVLFRGGVIILFVGLASWAGAWPANWLLASVQ
jgi:hypothetical protein